MNKIKNLSKISALIIFLTIFASSLFPWQEGESKEDVVWKKEKYSDSPNSKFNISEFKVGYEISNVYSYKDCSIYKHEDGSGITIATNDPDWNGIHLVQFVTIRKKVGEKGASFSCRFYKVVEKNGERRYYYPLVEGYYDIFYNNYRDAAKELPLEIRKKFHGYYGISE